MRLADNISLHHSSPNAYAPVTSFLVHRRHFWVSRIPPPYSRLYWDPLTLNSYGSDAYNAIVTLHSAEGSWNIERLLKLPEGTQPQITPGELLACEAIVKNDARVQALAKEVGELTLSNLMLGSVTHSVVLQALSRIRFSLMGGQ